MKSLVSFPGNYPAWSTYDSNKPGRQTLNKGAIRLKKFDFFKYIVFPRGSLQRKNEALSKNFLSKVQFFSFISLNFLEHKIIDFCA